MFGKKTTPKKELKAIKKAVEADTPDLVVDKPQSMGMPGFTADPEPAPAAAAPAAAAPEPQGIPGFGGIGAPVPEPAAAAPAPAPVAAPVAAPEPAREEYQIVETALGPDGLYVYKIVTNKYLGELGGVYGI